MVAAYDGVDPEGDLSVPADLAFFLEDTSTEGSFKFAKDKMDATGRTADYINPVVEVMRTQHNLYLTLSEVYTWRTKATEPKTDKSRLCSSTDGKNKASRLRAMLDRVAAHIKTLGPKNMFKQLSVARKGPQGTTRSPAKSAVKKQRDEVCCHFLPFFAIFSI